MVATASGGTNEEYPAHSETMIVFHMCFSTVVYIRDPSLNQPNKNFTVIDFSLKWVRVFL